MEEEKQRTSLEPPSWPHNDWIGSVDKRSNLRKIRFAEPLDETDTECAYRKMREETYEWNHRFWAKQNHKFIQAKEEFTEEILAKKEEGFTDEDGAKRVLSVEEMAEFYRTFLQDNRKVLKDYNRDWYRKNFGLLWPAFRVAVNRVVRKFIR